MGKLPRSVFGQIDVLVEESARSGNVDFTLPSSVLTHFKDGGLRLEEVNHVIGFGGEIDKEISLTRDQTEKFSRLAHIISLAERVFEEREKAFMWLRMPNRSLGGKRPIDQVSAEVGARLVEESLLQIEYGVYG
jgi:hypothetical protein